MSYVYLLSDKKGLYYVGKSVNIYNRILKHKYDIKIQGGCCSRELDIDFECQVLEEYSNDLDMAQGEQKWYDTYKKEHGDKLVNKYRPLNDCKEYRKQYRAEHAEAIKEYKKQYRAEHAEEKKQYRVEHAEEMKEYLKQYRAEHSEERKEYYKQYCAEHAEEMKKKYDCECGGEYTHNNKARHFKTKKHVDYTKVKPN